MRPCHGVAAFQGLGSSLTPVQAPVGDRWILSRDEPTLRAAPGPVACSWMERSSAPGGAPTRR